MRVILFIMVFCIVFPLVYAGYNSDGVTVAVNEWIDFKLTYVNDSGQIVDTADCSWVVLDPDGIVVVNASWTSNPQVLSIPAYYNYSFKPTKLGFYYAIVTCNLSSDNPPNQVLDASFVVAEDTKSYLESKIIQYQSHGGGFGGNFTISVPNEFGFWKAKEVVYLFILIVLITLLYVSDLYLSRKKQEKNL